MTIKYIHGDATAIDSGILLHGCNMKGSMGRGIALTIKKKFPKAYEDYLKHYHSKQLGEVIWTRIRDDLIIGNCLTQVEYGRGDINGIVYVSYDAIQHSFEEAVVLAKELGLSLNFPKIGAGLAGGDWGVIERIIQKADNNNEIDKNCFIYTP